LSVGTITFERTELWHKYLAHWRYLGQVTRSRYRSKFAVEGEKNSAIVGIAMCWRRLCKIRKYRPNSITLSRSQTWSQNWFSAWLSTSFCRSATRSWPAGDLLGRQRVADRFELSRHDEIARTCLRQVGNQLCDQVCDLDSVMEFGLNSIKSRPGFRTINNSSCVNFPQG